MMRARLIGISLLVICIDISCAHTGPLTQQQSAIVRDSIQQRLELIAKDISQEGPIAWLKYFENTPGFCMAFQGQLVFPDNDSATNFIKNILVKNVKRIELRWNNIRVDPLTPKFAGIAANYHEDITDFTGKTMPYDGYFTGIAEETIEGWQLRSLHWSNVNPK